ncbi:hypothetical protein GOP47_0003384 [Adiantum capillus-veneris]|uniref:Uncharacterized protein n=1 Tax=Adiantum capillus-veneris TaxID=13818 RepID=A0A9D4VBV8_ADICA|nr:hypothetical protein GOP47_0003384 [Adiantum capillus-veneris]
MASTLESSTPALGERYPRYFSQMFHMVFPVLACEWDLIGTLACERNFEELEWLIRLLTTSDPYLVESVSPIAQAYPFDQDDYRRLVTFLVNMGTYDEEENLHDYTDGTYGLMDDDFVYLDDEDRGLALGFSPNLYNILFP